MTGTDVRQTLLDVSGALDVPAPDRLAFQARVRVERRRRLRSLAGAGVAAAAALAVLASGVAALFPSGGAGPGPATVPDPVVALPSAVVGFVVGDRLVVGGPAGYEETDISARNVLGVTGDLVVLTDATGALVGVPVTEDGRTGQARPLVPGVVDHVWRDEGTGRLVAQNAAGDLLASDGGDDWIRLPGSGTDLLVTDGEHRVESDEQGMTLVHDGGSRPLPVRGGIIGADLGGGVLALSSLREVRFFDTTTGRRLSRVTGEGTGELSPDATRWVGSLDGDPVIADPRTGARDELGGLPAPPGDVGWLDGESVVVTTRKDDASGLWECNLTDRTCVELYRDPTGTLKLHS